MDFFSILLSLMTKWHIRNFVDVRQRKLRAPIARPHLPGAVQGSSMSLRHPLFLAVASSFCGSFAVAAPPVVTPPVSVQVRLGESASFTVGATGATPFNYHWYHWATDGTVTSIDRCDTTATCTIASVTQADAGEYNVEVYDVNGEHASAEPRATLTIVDDEGIVAASCSRNDVQAAIDQIPAGGSGKVLIPAGSCDWGTGLIVVDDKASIWIKGAGRDATTITRSGANDGGPVLSDNNPAAIITFDCNDGQKVEFSDIHFKGPVDSAGHLRNERYSRGLELRGNCQDFKVHDARISKFTYAGIVVKGMDSRGVIYNNEILDNWMNGYGYGVSIQGWTGNVNAFYWPALDLGSANAVYVEDNYISGSRHSVASNEGSRYVARHNEMVVWRTNSERNPALLHTFQDGQIDAHGPYEANANVPWNETQSGSRSWEVYDNLVKMTNDTYLNENGNEANPAASNMRGGNGMYFCNQFDRGDRPPPADPKAANWLFTNPLVSWEGNDRCHEFDYPAPYQVGFQGKSFFWNNTGHVTNNGNASPNTYMDDETCYPRLIAEDRDYFNRAPQAQDDDQWGAYSQYQPYPYPHPLRHELIFADGFDSGDNSLECSAGRNGRPTASRASVAR